MLPMITCITTKKLVRSLREDMEDGNSPEVKLLVRKKFTYCVQSRYPVRNRGIFSRRVYGLFVCGTAAIVAGCSSCWTHNLLHSNHWTTVAPALLVRKLNARACPYIALEFTLINLVMGHSGDVWVFSWFHFESG